MRRSGRLKEVLRQSCDRLLVAAGDPRLPPAGSGPLPNLCRLARLDSPEGGVQPSRPDQLVVGP